MTADVVLVSTGRRPFTQGLNLEGVGVITDSRGCNVVDDHFQTTVPGIYAIGDVIPGPMLAHKAEEDCVACVASMGKTEEQVKAEGTDYKVSKFSFMANSRARSVDDTDGLVKFIADAKTDKILGAHIMGPNAGELIGECVLAMEYGASSGDIARTCNGHPTLSEAVKEAAMATAFGKAIHS
ncbi:dihydrolipoyl mitochondrial-like [Micractinium conductrix]|uniref:Dihydrolipoyl mitochondrial-like n=1 Tax=Micractinium conductrix TaxID=554055 RepID=A0A2P6V3Z5_9CHLO|nr:dihydrolipoyl mitochondrial-like [Micractinium conductrix]|eukprot:PSC68811.1 dihydrolipoyl mitochondrial-like [Micractinium conductrix]